MGNDYAKSAEQIALAVWVLTAFAVAAGLGLATAGYVLPGLVVAVAAGVIGAFLAWRIHHAGRRLSAER